MNIKKISNNSQYEEALEEIDLLWDAKPNTKKGYELESLVKMVEEYELNNNLFSSYEPIEITRFKKNQFDRY